MPLDVPWTNYIVLLDSDTQFANQLGRDMQASRSQYADYITTKDPVRAHEHGARCEYAAWLYFRPACWLLFTREKQTPKPPDIEGFIEVRGRYEARHHPLYVLPKDPPEYAYLGVYAHNHPTYEIFGWVWGHEIKDKEEYYQCWIPGQPCFAPKRGDPIIKPPELLYAELRRRQTDKYGPGWFDRVWIDNIDERQ